MSHTLSFAVILAVLTNLAQYTAYKCKDRRGSHWQRFGPLYLICAAIPLIMADLTRHVLQDAGVWSGPSSSMYRPDCSSVHGIHGLRCLTLTGWFFTIVFTYTGFASLLVGVAWATNLHATVVSAWRQARRRRV